MSQDPNGLSPNKRALLKIRQLKQQLADHKRCGSGYESIAIVSMACRFPKSSCTPEEFWQLLIDQTDVVGQIPAGRWDLEAFYDEDPDVPGKMYARHGAFLDSIDTMDPEFFGISPREATWVDPQQRLLMEVGWEALERAGWPADKIGDDTGVFIGWMHNDYQNEASDSFLNLNPYIATGAAGSFLSGRLAHFLGLRGPSIAVDTACSSSLVALHLACQSLQQRDCGRAIVGGVNVICSPTTNILTCKLKALSPDGHSRAFDAAANGYLRGEGCGVVALRRLEDAQADNDPVLGIIRGSAVGHNGSDGGLTVPNPKAQEEVIRKALALANLSAAEVSYLEAHGTGTELGDPIEIRAASAALAQHRDGSMPLLVGSVKTNIGHLEAAAGIAGLIKVLLAMHYNKLPGQLNFENPNPHIQWEKIPVKVLTQPSDWPNPKKRIAGVSAFGMSGTNAHVVVEAPPIAEALPFAANDAHPPAHAKPQLIALSGKSEKAVQTQAKNLERAIADDPHLALADVAYTTGTCRSHLEQRGAIVAENRDDARRSLRTLAAGEQSETAFSGSGRRAPRVAWQFSGQGSQFVGMAKGLYESEPVFREAIDFCEERLRRIRDESLTEVLFEREDLIHHTSWTQPCLFAIQMGLAKLLNQYGLKPDVVLGHSVGQYAAACVAGIMSWEDGLHLINERGRLIGDLPEGGRMVAVFAPCETVREAIASHEAVSLAAVNGTHVVISGETSAVEVLVCRFESDGVRCTPLETSHAFHSQLMNPALAPFQKVADSVEFVPAEMPLICNISGKVLDADAKLDGAYWTHHIRQPVQFSASIESAQEMGCEILLELGPQAVLTRMASANWKQNATSLISCLQKDLNDQHSLLAALGRLYVRGVKPDFASLHSGALRRRVLLPTYPFQRRRFWGPDKPRAIHAEFHTAHPLLGAKLELAGVDSESRYEQFIEPDSPPWLPDHEVMGQIVMPGAAYIEMALAASESRCIEQIVFQQPLRPTARTSMQTILRKAEQTQRIETYSAVVGATGWTRHFTAELSADLGNQPEPVERSTFEQECPEQADPEAFYRKMDEIGLRYGPNFQTIRSIRFTADAVLTHLRTEGDIRGYMLPPTLLDGALHSLAVGLLKEDDGNLFLPVSAEKIRCFHPVESEAWCYARWLENDGEVRSADITLFDDDGKVLAQIHQLKVQRVSRAALRQMSGSGAERLLYELAWQPCRLPSADESPKQWLVVSSAIDPFADTLISELDAAGHSVRSLRLDNDAGQLQRDGAGYVMNGRSYEQWDEFFRENPTEDKSAYMPDGIAWVFDTTPQSQTDLLSEAESTCGALLHLLRQCANAERQPLQCGLQLITTGAISAPNQASCNADQTKYWGLGRVIGAEQPDLRCRLIDIPAGRPDGTADAVLSILQTETNDNQFLVRGDELYVPRMTSVQRERIGNPVCTVRREASYLITGGLGVLGRQAAKWFAERGAGQVVLVSRRAPDAATNEFLSEIGASGCEVVVHRASLDSRKQVESLVGRFGSDLKPLSGIIHAAGVLDDALLTDQSWDRFQKVLAPKVIGAKLLDELTREFDLDFFVLYSSAASVFGSPGQSNYAMANAFLDGLAHQRRSIGLPATSINWGPWAEGMADDERIRRRMSLQGIVPLTAAEAHQAMQHMLVSGDVQATVIDVDWRKMRIGMGGKSPAMLEGLAPPRTSSSGRAAQLVAKIRRMPRVAQRELLVKTLQESLQKILSTPAAPEADRPLIEMGLDSLMAVEFSTELQEMLGEEFSVGPTMLFDHPSIDAISDYILEMVGTDQTAPEVQTGVTAAPESESERVLVREPVAIIGLSCRFPGASNIDEFWDNLLRGVDSVREVPAERWDVERFYSEDREPGTMYTREGGFLDDVAGFDTSFFNVSAQEACWIDPQHRMLLENSHHAMEHAGIVADTLDDKNVGVFMGIMGQDYAFLPRLDEVDVIEGFQGAGLSHSAGVGRISFAFGFEGPSIAVDTASSSSLVAILQAVRSLQDRNCNLALAGGVNAILAPVNSLLMSKAGLLSPDGRCKSFSAAADGFGRGEGCGVVVLKRLSDAQRHGDRVLAVIRGGAVVHNGKSSAITAPNSKSQVRAIQEALHDAEVAPSQVQYLEAHGTGTAFGDPMELGAAVSVYGKGRKRDEPLLVGSVKANISHLEAAGGISGLIKTVLAIHHGVIPPQIHFDEPSPHIPWNRMPVRVVTEKTQWPDAEERIAGVTALGLVGTHAHLIVASPTEFAVAESQISETTDTTRKDVLVLSARSESALADLASDYHQALLDDSVNVTDVCVSAATGRRHYEHRFACTVTSRKQVLDQLDQLARGSNQLDAVPAKSPPKIAWVFSGDTANTVGAAEQLFRREPVFREFIEELDDHLCQHVESAMRFGFSLRAWLSGENSEQNGSESRLSAEVGLFALHSGLARLWKTWGIDPDAVTGFGVGQYSAACSAGVLCFKDAVTLVARQASIAANASTDDGRQELFLLDEFESYADTLNYYPPNLPLVCSRSAQLVPIHRSLGGSYWRERIGSSEMVTESLRVLLGQDCELVLQLGPGVSGDWMDGFGVKTANVTQLSSLAGGEDPVHSMQQKLAELYVVGADPNFKAYYHAWPRRRVDVPLYPFQRKRYWITEISNYLERTNERVST